MNPKRAAMLALCAAATWGVAQAAEMTIYKQPQFSGGRVTVTDAARDLAPLGVTDQASSLVVQGGRWEVCTQPDFNGDCRTLEPGRYATLDTSLNHRIESVRQVEQQARGRDRDRYARDRGGYRDEGRAYEPPDNGGYRDQGRAYESQDNGGWNYGNRDRSEGGSAWRP